MNEKERVKDYFNGSERWQDSIYNAPGDYFDRAMIRRKNYAFEMLDQLPSVSGKVALDIGCGGGFYADHLLRKGFEVYGIDSSSHMVEKAKLLLQANERNSHAHLMQGDVENLQFNDGTFDLVLCVGVLGYLRTDYRALREIQRVTKPGGHVLLNITNLWSLSDWDNRLRGLLFRDRDPMMRPSQPGTKPLRWMTENAGVIYKCYSLTKFEGLMKTYGFRKVDSMTFYFPLRILRKLKFIPASFPDKLELFLERSLRGSRLSILASLGTAFTGIFEKISS